MEYPNLQRLVGRGKKGKGKNYSPSQLSKLSKMAQQQRELLPKETKTAKQRLREAELKPLENNPLGQMAFEVAKFGQNVVKPAVKSLVDIMPKGKVKEVSETVLDVLPEDKRLSGGVRVATLNRSSRDPNVHNERKNLRDVRAMETQYNRPQNRVGRTLSRGGAMTGAGFFDDVLNTVGNVGKAVAPFAPLLLGLGKNKKLRGMALTGGAYTGGAETGGALTGRALTGGMMDDDLDVLGGAMTGGLTKRHMRGKALTGGKKKTQNYSKDEDLYEMDSENEEMEGGALLGQDGQGTYKGKAMTGGRKMRGKAMTGASLTGGGFFDDLVGTIGNVGKAVAPFAPLLLGLGKKKKRVASQKQKARGQIVKQIMNERGVSLGEASRIVSQEGLYK